MTQRVYDAAATERLGEWVRQLLHPTARASEVAIPLWDKVIEALRDNANPNHAAMLITACQNHCEYYTPGGDSEAETTPQPGDELQQRKQQAFALALEKGANRGMQFDWEGRKNVTLLHVAVKALGLAPVRTLIAHGVKPDQKDSNGDTAISQQRTSNVRAILELVRAGADLGNCNKKNRQPFQVWEWQIHRDLLAPDICKEYGRELLMIHEARKQLDDYNLPYEIREMWNKQFDAIKTARETRIPRDTVLTRYVQGAAAEKERSA